MPMFPYYQYAYYTSTEWFDVIIFNISVMGENLILIFSS